jgi:hypothetical protein
VPGQDRKHLLAEYRGICAPIQQVKGHHAGAVTPHGSGDRILNALPPFSQAPNGQGSSRPGSFS